MHLAEGASFEGEPIDLVLGAPNPSVPGSTQEHHSKKIAVEPIAIIGIGCRLPGAVNSTTKLWELLRDGKTGQCKVPSNRFNVDAFYHPNGIDRPGSMHAVGGYFLQEDPRNFDPQFFGINPLEATQMDPQQRKLLEVVFEAFESAGVTLEDVSGANIGCYVGNFTYDFTAMQSKDPEYLFRNSATGMGATILGNRISHTFNLKGPSLVLDTACSSSLYSLHVACSALSLHECDAAVVAGTNLIQSPDQHLSIIRSGVLSGTSTCHTFSTTADGYGRADGVSCLYVKRLTDAIRDNDPIRGVIKGTAVNSNGRTPGITLPSSKEQEAVIRKAYSRAGVSFNDTTYVECHGTGTPVGDPIEVEGVSRVFGKSAKDRQGKPPLLIGSVKTNLGHSEAASGLASVMKMVLALEHGAIPGTVGVEHVNPKIKTEEWNVSIVKELTPWPASGAVRRAGINSFGYGGANAHAIIESFNQGPGSLARTTSKVNGFDPDQAYLVPLSARSPDSLRRRAQDFQQYIAQHSVDIRDLAYTLGQRRSHLSHRGFFICRPKNLADDFDVENINTLSYGPTTGGESRKYAFVFTGQGAQWAEMGKSLFKEYPVFADAVSDMDNVLRNLPKHPPNWTLKETILEPAETSKIHDALRSQPICTALQVALVILLRSWDIVPFAVVGHSSGEIAAAFAAGRITMTEAIVSAYYRGYAVSQLTVTGGMMAVGLHRDVADNEIKAAGLHGLIRVACVNSPESTTLSGDQDAVEALVQNFNARKIFARRLNTGGKAYHSHHMATIGELYESLLSQRMGFSKQKTKSSAIWISSVSGEEYHGEPGAAYWRSNLESPVLFSDVVEKLLGLDEKFQLIELGPHSALEMPIKQIKTKLNDQSPYASALIRFKDATHCVLSMVGQLYLRGCHVSWAKVNRLLSSSGDTSRLRVVHSLPPYPWTYEDILWRESRISSEFRYRKFPRHELLGSLVPGGNGLEKSWRNVLKLADVSWLEGHKLQDTVVFPGAAYIAMGVEAMRQVFLEKSASQSLEDVTFKLSNVKILSALAVSAEPTAELELFTTLRPSPISSASVSKQWWDFTIVSYDAGMSTTRATGTTCVSTASQGIKSGLTHPSSDLELSHPRVWYRALSQVGLNFGSDFQSIESFEVPSVRNRCVCRATAPLIQDHNNNFNNYIVHPITLDAMLQTSIVASCSGEVRSLRAKVPVSIGEIQIQAPVQTSNAIPLSSKIYSEVRVVGFGLNEGEADLVTPDGKTVVQFKDFKTVPYNGAARLNQDENGRHPMLRVLWKPDIECVPLMSSESLDTAFSQFTASFGETPDVTNEGFIKVRACLDWMSHKHPALKVLELGNWDRQSINDTIEFLGGKSAFPRLHSYVCGAVFEDGKLYGHQIDITKGIEGEIQKDSLAEISAEDHFDVVMIQSREIAKAYLENSLSNIKSYIAPNGGILLALLDDRDSKWNRHNDFHLVESSLRLGDGQLVLGYPKSPLNVQEVFQKFSHIVVVDRGYSALGRAIVKRLESIVNHSICRISVEQLSKDQIPSNTLVISLVESKTPLLANSSDSDIEKVKILTDNSATLMWITSGDLMRGTRPAFGVAFGLSRAVMAEQPSLKWFTYDVDDITASPQQIADNIISILASAPSNRHNDFEFIQKDGIIHVSRFAPSDNLNKAFRQTYGNELSDISLEEAKPVQLDIKEAGNFDTLFFKQVTPPEKLGPLDVQVSVRTVSLNAKDYYTLGGKTETKDATCSIESCGIVERIGSGVTDLRPGDRVVAMAPSFFRTSEIFPAWACQKLNQEESFNTICTLPLVYSTALYAFRDRANLQAGESVLIHSAAGGLGIAAINVARMLGAGDIFATVSSEEKRDYLVQTFGIKRENIFSSRDGAFLNGIMDATSGAGVDVVLNSLVGDLLHASWKCCSAFGRFVEVGKRDLVDCGKLDMSQFLRNVTFTAFDLSGLYYHPSPAQNQKWAQLLKDVLHLFRSGQIGHIDHIKVFDVADITNAFRYFSTQSRIGKVVISLEKPKTSVVRVQRSKYRMKFNKAKTYIMIGCLGGLGRSISRWMVSRGARKFVFLGRSGTDKLPAKQLISSLEQQGATCKVIRGDVTVRSDVEAVVAAAEGQIGGVIQAAMGLHEALWTSMSNKEWHTSIDPKLTGTWNLHHAIQGQDDDLDFFLMTSSISGSVGTATEANYCAANYFLDIFARYRRSLGLPASAIGLGMISEVGYLHENPEIEALLLRKGIQAINEDELLQIIDITLFDSQNGTLPSGASDTGAQAHVLTGLEPFGLKELRRQGWEGVYPTLTDSRAAIINRVLENDNTLSFKGHSSRLQADVLLAIQEGGSPFDVICGHITKRFSNLVLLSAEKVDVNKALSDYGIDSMISAEFRSWFYQAFKVDIPFLELMGPSASILSLSKTVFAEVEQDLV